MPLQIGSPYRVFVQFSPPLSTAEQARALLALGNQAKVLLIGFSAAQASFVLIPVKQKDVAALKVGAPWFSLSGGIAALPVATAIITRIIHETTVHL